MKRILQALTSRFTLKRLGRIGQGAMVLIWALAALHMVWTPIQIGYMIVTIIGGMFLFSGLFILGSGVSF